MKPICSSWTAITLLGLAVSVGGGGAAASADDGSPAPSPAAGSPAAAPSASSGAAAGGTVDGGVVVDGGYCEGGVGDGAGRARLSGTLRAVFAYNPARGFRPPTTTPIYREAVVYYRYWPKYWYGDPRWNLRPTFPMVYMPTDTTQLGVYYSRVPQWMPNPGMYPPPPRSEEWETRGAPIGWSASNCGTVSEVGASAPAPGPSTPAGGTPTPAPEMGNPAPRPSAGAPLQPIPQRAVFYYQPRQPLSPAAAQTSSAAPESNGVEPAALPPLPSP